MHARAEHRICMPHNRSKPHANLQNEYIDELSQISEEHDYRRAEVRKSQHKDDVTYDVVNELHRINAWIIAHASCKYQRKYYKEAVHEQRRIKQKMPPYKTRAILKRKD